jgi:predicted double-glycine peptidase
MRSVNCAALGAVVLVVFAARGYSGAPQQSEWDVSGIHNEEGAYTGKATLVLDQLDATIDVTAKTATGKTLAWSGKGKLDAGAIEITLDTGWTIPDAKPSEVKGKALYVLGADGTLSGYWQLTTGATSSTRMKPHPGGTETLTLRSGQPLLPASPKLPPPSLPPDALRVPMVTQPDEYGCGAASLQAVLYYYRVSDGDLHSLYKPLGTSASNGTDPPEIVAFARTRGLTATYTEGANVGIADLQASLWNRDPVMLVIQAWKETQTPWKDDVDDAHWVVLVGLDASYAYFMDPWAHFGLGYMPISELLERWHCAESGKTVQHECIFFHGLAPASSGLVRMQ